MKELIDIVWNNRDLLKEKKYSDAVKSTLEKLNKGEIKVAEKIDSKWIVNEWVKKAVILFFPLMEMKTIELGPFEFHDKIKLKTNYKRTRSSSRSSCNRKIWVFYSQRCCLDAKLCEYWVKYWIRNYD